MSERVKVRDVIEEFLSVWGDEDADHVILFARRSGEHLSYGGGDGGAMGLAVRFSSPHTAMWAEGSTASSAHLLGLMLRQRSREMVEKYATERWFNGAVPTDEGAAEFLHGEMLRLFMEGCRSNGGFMPDEVREVSELALGYHNVLIARGQKCSRCAENARKRDEYIAAHRPTA